MESLLDEATAELAKMEWAPVLATIEATFKIKKAVPLHTTLRIDCKVEDPPGRPQQHFLRRHQSFHLSTGHDANIQR